jgi:xanthine dehydrogenase accessory factor
LASGVALRLHRSGFRIVVTELPGPLVVRRLASFAQAVFDGSCRVEEVAGQLTQGADETLRVLAAGKVAVLIDHAAEIRHDLNLFALVDGCMTKKTGDTSLDDAPRVIGLGPGFTVGENCHAVIETNRGPFLGRVYWQGSALTDTGIPESVKGFDVERVLYAPAEGILQAAAKTGDLLEPDGLIAAVDGLEIRAKFKGVLRGLVQQGLKVNRGMKVGDLDPRCDPRLCILASDKALSIGGAVLEALLMMNKESK